ncbi:restriction endonuclease subunit S [Escherichia coli]|uniref:restriction endonuclease subunit S n=1 Tax=Escherichia sp. F1 TaxID=1849427 RepID=UPI001FFF7496|nr:restriction endonuclease subunit S [Escherichia coli]MCK2283942.1 restriction endonuclease subunit S [Escherichia coli]MCN5590457.1 restriction endonuclease subunit S [Escherichia coli]HAX5197583.1 restriction endonuclease subunit S [Escherichia coli]
MAGLNKYQAYPEYRDSGVEWLGEIPVHWNIKRLGHFFEERREKVSDKDFPALSVTMQGIVPQLETAAKTDAGDNRKLVLKDDFVINSRSDRKGSAGVSQLNGSVSLISIVMQPKKINVNFAHHLLRSYPFQEEFYRYGKGIVADLWSTNASEMKNILLPEIPGSESENIANFLNYETAKIDNLIEKQQQLIELLKEKRQAVISHAVTKGLNPDVPMKDSGVEWLGEVPKHWHICKLKWFANLKSGDFITSNSIEPEGNYPVYGGNGLRGYYSHFTHNGEYVLIGRQGALCGNINYAIGKFWASEHAVVVTPNERAVTIWLGELLRIMNLNQYSVSAAQPGLAVERITDLYIPIPPYQEQINIGTYISKYISLDKKLIEHSTDNIELLKERRTALISAAVTGKIDLRNWTAPIPKAETPTEVSA